MDLIARLREMADAGRIPEYVARTMLREAAAALEAAREDADRYRYLRDVWGGVQSVTCSQEHRAHIRTPTWQGDFDTLDAAIDRAQEAQP